MRSERGTKPSHSSLTMKGATGLLTRRRNPPLSRIKAGQRREGGLPCANPPCYGTPSTPGRLNPIAIHASTNFSMNLPE